MHDGKLLIYKSGTLWKSLFSLRHQSIEIRLQTNENNENKTVEFIEKSADENLIWRRFNFNF